MINFDTVLAEVLTLHCVPLCTNDNYGEKICCLNHLRSEIKKSGWDNSYRYWHNFDNHLLPLLTKIHNSYQLNDVDKRILYTVAIYHDWVYFPGAKDNELNSVKVYEKHFGDTCHTLVKDIIMDTESLNKPHCHYLSDIFRCYDCPWATATNTYADMIKFEKCIFKEFQQYDWREYRSKRLEFLKNVPSQYEDDKLDFLIDYVENQWHPTIGIYPGSFDPWSIGHLAIYKQATELFDKVIIAVGVNSSKPPRAFSISELRMNMPYIQVDEFEGLLTDYVNNKGYPVTIIRGIRSGYDVESEITLLRQIQSLSDIPFVHLISPREYEHVSSSFIRELYKHEKKDEANKYLGKINQEKTGL